MSKLEKFLTKGNAENVARHIAVMRKPEVILKALEHADPAVHYAVIQRIQADRKKFEPHLKQVLPKMLEIAKNKLTPNRYYAIQLIKSIGDPHALPGLLEIYEDENRHATSMTGHLLEPLKDAIKWLVWKKAGAKPSEHVRIKYPYSEMPARPRLKRERLKELVATVANKELGTGYRSGALKLIREDGNTKMIPKLVEIMDPMEKNSSFGKELSETIEWLLWKKQLQIRKK
ncbi:MAG TPA: hypothetical protein VGQ00_00820 [Candidatus Norongarragalinales archaeon]|jgi:hypothetical protein|nr:hypothetical protein [Candidatus Norongarragalinales archaeon]